MILTKASLAVFATLIALTVADKRPSSGFLTRPTVVLRSQARPSSRTSYADEDGPAGEYEVRPRQAYYEEQPKPFYRPAIAAIPVRPAYGPAPVARPAPYVPEPAYTQSRPSYAPEPEYNNPPAKYNFAWEVRDSYSQNNYGHQEARDGNKVSGRYYVHLPDGRLQRVDYTADEYGYRPVVTYEGEARHPEPTKYSPAYAPAPVAQQYQPKPVQYRPEPVQYRPQPVQYRPEPVQYRPEPVQYRPEPVQYRPEPVQYRPEPVQYPAESVEYRRTSPAYEQPKPNYSGRSAGPIYRQ